jgi:hypothetical protein
LSFSLEKESVMRLKFDPLLAFFGLAGGVVILVIIAVILQRASARNAPPPAAHEVWKVTETAVALPGPPRERVLEIAAEEVKRRLRNKTACGDPFCNCGCHDGGECICTYQRTPTTPPPPVVAPIEYVPQFQGGFRQGGFRGGRRGGGC